MGGLPVGIGDGMVIGSGDGVLDGVLVAGDEGVLVGSDSDEHAPRIPTDNAVSARLRMILM